MAAINITLDVPFEIERINIAALKKELTAFAKILINSQPIAIPKTMTEETDPFAELDTSWGGHRDANEIAEELHAMRTNTRIAKTW